MLLDTQNGVMEKETADPELFRLFWLLMGLELLSQYILEECGTPQSLISEGKSELKLFLKDYETCFVPGEDHPSLDDELIDIIFSQNGDGSADRISSRNHSDHLFPIDASSLNVSSFAKR